MSGHDDADKIRINFKPGLKQGNAIHFRHHQIRQQQVVILFRKNLQCVGAGGKSRRFVSLHGERFTKGRHQLGFVINDHDAAHFEIIMILFHMPTTCFIGHSSLSIAILIPFEKGRVIHTLVPFPGPPSLVILSVPLCA